MTRKELLAQLELEYANIYEFSGDHGDAPLNILDDFLDSANLYESGCVLMESLNDDIDPIILDNATLIKLLEVYKEVVNECQFELGE